MGCYFIGGETTLCDAQFAGSSIGSPSQGGQASGLGKGTMKELLTFGFDCG